MKVSPSPYVEQVPILLEALVHHKRDSHDVECNLDSAIRLANHQEEECHNQIAKLGAIDLLSRFLIKSYNQDELPLKVLQKICSLLFLFLQCNDDLAVALFKDVACDTLCCLLWIIVDCHQHPETNDNDGAKNVIHRVSKLEFPLPQVANAGRLVRFLQRILKEDGGKSHHLSQEAMRLLDAFAKHEESKPFLMGVPGLVYDVVHAATINRPNRKDQCVPLDFFVIRFLRKICWDTRNKLRVTKTKGFVDVLLKCARHRRQEIQKEAIGVFWMLSFDTASVRALCEYPRDAALQTLAASAKLPELSGLALPALQRMVRRNKLRNKQTKTWLLSHDSITRSGGSSQETGEGEVQSARLVESLCRSTSVNEPCHSNLMDALSTMAVSSSDAIRFWAAKAFHGQSLFKMNQFFIARTPNVLCHVVQLARDPVAKVRERATSALLQLTSERSNASLAKNYNVLETLLCNARREEATTSKAARLSVEGILSLASQEASRERIAKHHDCVSTLAKFGVSNDEDRELKQAALHGVIMLVHLL